MRILALFVIPIILVSFFLEIRFAYVVTLLCSLAAATFLYADQALINILLIIIIFNIMPLACLTFRNSLGQSRLSLEAAKEKIQAAYEAMLKERSLVRQSNARLASDVAQITELYKVTRVMSAALGFQEIFDIFCRKLVGYFHFKKCSLALMDEQKEPLNIDKLLQLEYEQPQVYQVDRQTYDRPILKKSLRTQNISYFKEEAAIAAPLMAENKAVGVLVIEGLPPEALENFSILANQFSLEFRRIRLYQKIQELAITDGLTGLFVRRYFLERLREEIERSSRHHLHLGFLMIDIDHFKQCNDTFGHLTGDVVLREVGKRINDCVREIDFVARFGGEEFSVILPDTDKESARQVGERIRVSIDSQKISAYDEAVGTQVSIGVAAFPEDATKLKSLIDKADQALYRAKQEGRNRVLCF